MSGVEKIWYSLKNGKLNETIEVSALRSNLGAGVVVFLNTSGHIIGLTL